MIELGHWLCSHIRQENSANNSANIQHRAPNLHHWMPQVPGNQFMTSKPLRVRNKKEINFKI